MKNIKKIAKEIISMTKMNDLFKCQICRNVVKVTRPGKGTLVCCNKPMIQPHMEF